MWPVSHEAGKLAQSLCCGINLMDQSDDIKQLLTEIRNLQRDHLDEYKRVTERMLEIQGEAVRRQIAFESLL